MVTFFLKKTSKAEMLERLFGLSVRLQRGRADGARHASDDEAALRGMMAGYLAGDASAFEALYARLEPEMRFYLSALARGAAPIEDLMQEVFLQLHRSRHTYSSTRPLRPWLFAIARHVFKMWLRTSSRRLTREKRYVATRAQEVSEDRSLEHHELVVRAIDLLSPKQREPVFLHHVLGLTFSEIGALLGIRAVTAKVRAHRGLTYLRRHAENVLEVDGTKP